MSKKKVPTCKPSLYAVIYGQKITYGFRCPTHHILTRRYSSQELCDQRVAEHIAKFAKKQKKSKL